MTVGTREVNSFPEEETRLALGQVESSTLKRLPRHHEAEGRFPRWEETGMSGSPGNPVAHRED